MDILVNGNQEEKYRLSFRLFDRENRNYFTIEDFSYMISSMVSIWCVLTGAQFSI